MENSEGNRGYCPCCNGVHQQSGVGGVGGTQTNGCDVDFTTWRCGGCGSQWSGEFYETAPDAQLA
jgi:hypothetical protein